MEELKTSNFFPSGENKIRGEYMNLQFLIQKHPCYYLVSNKALFP